MKTIFKPNLSYFLLILIVLFFTSCQMTEELTVTKNGSGTVSFKVDASFFMQMMGDRLNKEKTNTNYDTIIHFKDVIKQNRDSILKLSQEKQKSLKRLENFSMRMQMNSDTKKMNFDMFTNFKDVKELNNMLNSFQEGYGLASKSNKLLASGKQTKKLSEPKTPSTKVNYLYSKKKFERNTQILNPEQLKKEVDSLGKLKTMFSSSTYKLIYTFPKRIKNASIKEAYYSADGKTITIEKNIIDYFSNPKILDFSVEF